MMARRGRKKIVKTEQYTSPVINDTKNSTVEIRETMLEKTEPRLESENNTGESFIKVLGLGILIFGVIVLLGIFIIAIITRFAPRLDKNMPIPIVSEIPTSTNSENITIKGNVDGAKEVIVYVNDKLQRKPIKISEDGTYEYNYEMKNEGDYKFQVATVRGFIIRSRSEKSPELVSKYDTTPPSKIVEFEYDSESSSSEYSLEGKAEPNSLIVLKSGDQTFTGRADSEGNFEIKDIVLQKGDNEFVVEIWDQSGNFVTADKKILVKYEVGDLNGNGVSTTANNANGTTELPSSAGILEDALNALGVNSVIMYFGIFCLALLGINMTVVALKLKRQK